MRTTIKITMFVAALAASSVGVSAQEMLAKIGSGVRPSVPLPETILIMTRTTLLMVGQANHATNYSVLRALASSNFREKNSEAALAEAFAKVRDVSLDYWSAATIVPVFTDMGISDNGSLRLAGHLPTRPVEMTFQLVFVMQDGGWRIDGLGIGARTVASLSAASAQPTQSPTGAAKPAVPAVVAQKMAAKK